ncbi:MAG: hypothetical protein SFW36_02585 [Leptolyngbyaceae cyanobacterium bins.59]|nr:hypothetical protein [Leptolyngbyaceae cyanobacterium bins.59]
MQYIFEILGVSPVLQFFSHQQEHFQQQTWRGVEYVSSYKCTLDAWLESIETIPRRRGWDQDSVVDSVVNFWLNNSDSVQRWQERLKDAGRENLLVARLSDLKSLQDTFEALLE